MATDTKKPDVKAGSTVAAPAPKPRVDPNVSATAHSAAPEPELTPEEAKKQAEDKKTHSAAIEKVAVVNERLAKDGSGERLDVQMRDGEAVYTWGNFVPTRKVTDEDLEALKTVKA